MSEHKVQLRKQEALLRKMAKLLDMTYIEVLEAIRTLGQATITLNVENESSALPLFEFFEKLGLAPREKQTKKE